MTVSGRLIVPMVGALISLGAYLAQNAWGLFRIDDVASAIQGLDRPGMLMGFFLLGVVEGTILLCFYFPGTAVVILLLLGLQPDWAEATQLLGCLMAGTIAGYGISFALGRLLEDRLPFLVGDAYFRKVRSAIGRFGLVSFIPAAIHPNQLAVAFAILGYFRVGRLWAYFAITILAQALWWASYASTTDLIAGQTLVTRANFQLYLAVLFFIWFLYELFFSEPRQ